MQRSLPGSPRAMHAVPTCPRWRSSSTEAISSGQARHVTSGRNRGCNGTQVELKRRGREPHLAAVGCSGVSPPGSALSRRHGGSGSKRHEGVGADELPDSGVRAKIAPPEHPAQEPQPVRMAPPKLERDRHAFVVGEEALFGHERLPARVAPRPPGRCGGCESSPLFGPQAEQIAASPVPRS